jgi:sugar lactone lactonase YvrE
MSARVANKDANFNLSKAVAGFNSRRLLITTDYPNLFFSKIGGTATSGHDGDGADANIAQIQPSPAGIWVDSYRNTYFTEVTSFYIRKISPGGIISSFGGTGSQWTEGTSGPIGTTSFNAPGGLFGDSSGNLYIGDDCFIWKYSFSTNIVTIVAGKATGGGSLAENVVATNAYLGTVKGIWVNTNGLYYADSGLFKIRRISGSIITTVAGVSSFGFSGDGAAATSAELYSPSAVYIAPVSGKMYIADTGNNRIRLVDTDGIITTFAGNGVTPFNGDNIPATSAAFGNPVDVKGDSVGNIFFPIGGHRIRMVDTNGIIWSYMGTGNAGFSPGLTSAATAQINYPKGIWIDKSSSTVYVSDVSTIHKSILLFPTSQPTRQPSSHPSGQPTSRPSIPTSQPSSRPSMPTSRPSNRPTSFPVISPSAQPTGIPSGMPSNQPTKLPSSRPSSQPTRLPTGQPSRQPVGRPSGQPSAQPSSHPTSQPSRRPSAQPSSQPSTIPSSQPFSRPSGQPSHSPTLHLSGLMSVGLVAYYPFTGNARDQSGNEINGEVHNATLTTDSLGTPNSAYSFNGITSYIAIPNTDKMNLFSDYTFSLWVKPGSTQQPCARIFDTMDVSFESCSQLNNYCLTQYYIGSGDYSGMCAALITNHWNHLVISNNITSTKIYLNSQLVASKRTVIGYPTINPNPGFPFMIGAWNSGSTKPAASHPQRFFTGAISEIRFYNVAFSDLQIKQLYHLEDPTGQPSSSPTQPSSQPTVQPSCRPSDQPSSNPGQLPTGQPVACPSSLPTLIPTTTPTVQPTDQPTAVPSCLPSSVPTNQPSGQPSSLPSKQPTNCPSGIPSARPSSVPGSQPTVQPSCRPSNQPTAVPTLVPTLQPFSMPSSQPTGQPTVLPSRKPSKQPSTQPSHRPTSQPSTQPSIQPSRQPTSLPTDYPSKQPVPFPTVVPSRLPTGNPSRQPTTLPSNIPSGAPSNQPNGKPSSVPSRVPTTLPSKIPSTHPSSQPSSYPSIEPTLISSSMPSSQPSCTPSRHSSQQPMSIPTSTPSAQPLSQLSKNPTTQPTERPSNPPSNRPSYRPSGLPSTQPSNEPSVLPTGAPTTTQFVSVPSCVPIALSSSQPSIVPSLPPSTIPTTFPTRSPSCLPNTIPSTFPSSEPSVQPSLPLVASTRTDSPTVEPTRLPTVVLSSISSTPPNIQASSTPSFGLSDQPIVSPSLIPTNAPSVCPTAVPSYPPSKRPTLQPFPSPSLTPLTEPTSQPAGRPTSSPFAHPTSLPSRQPTKQPLSFPTTQPSNHPSKRPIARPSGQPTVQPSSRPSSSQPTSSPTLFLHLHPSVSSLPTTTKKPTRSPSIRPTALPSIKPSFSPTSAPTSVLSIVGSNPYNFQGKLFLFGSPLSQQDLTFPNINLGNVISDQFSYVVFGQRKKLPNNLNLGTLDSKTGEFVSKVNPPLLARESIVRSSAVIGDFNGDGSLDLITGYPYFSLCLVYLGKNEIQSRQFSDLVVSFNIFGPEESEFGWAVSGLGDINKDH